MLAPRNGVGKECYMWFSLVLGGLIAMAPMYGAEATPPVDLTLDEIERALAADEAPGVTPRPSPPTRTVAGSGLMNPDISVILDFAAAVFTTEAPLQTGAHDPMETGFHLQQVEVAFSHNVDPYFRFDSFLIFTQFGVEVEEAYGTTLALPLNSQVRLGQFLTRFGRFNATHPHAWMFVDQMLTHGKFFGGENNRGPGVETSVLLPLPWYIEVVGSATDARGGATARSFYGGTRAPIRSPADLQYTTAIKQFFPLSDHWSLSWGLSGAFGPNPTGRGNRSDIYGTDLYLKWRPITAAGDLRQVSYQTELLHRRRQIPGGLLADHGLYQYLIWRFAQRWDTGVRHEWVSGLPDDPLDPDWTSNRQRFSGQLTFFPTEFSRLRAQVNHDRPGWTDPYWGAFFAVELSIGAHGAHAF
jgi:hypothetical protein